ncbi:M50 family metallopeptidase [Lacunimicrobium album]
MLRWCLKNPIQAVLIVWMFFYAMMGVHELGHILAAWATGGTVQTVVWTPWSISRTDVDPNPSPLVVAAAGPFIGALLPLLLDAVCACWNVSLRLFLGSFAAFCLLANGLYIGIGSFDGVGDCRDLLASGAEIWHLWCFGGLCTAGGIWRLHRVDLAWLQQMQSRPEEA